MSDTAFSTINKIIDHKAYSIRMSKINVMEASTISIPHIRHGTDMNDMRERIKNERRKKRILGERITYQHYDIN